MERVTRAKAELEAEATGLPRPRTPPRDMARDGDIYDDLREREDASEVVFDYSWRCPFNREQVC